MKKYGIKNLFEKEKSLSSDTIENVGKEVESYKFVEAHVEDKERHVPFVDFTEPSNFSKFGLAEEYYEQSIKRVYQTFPYDGSLYEKLVWHNSSSYLDKFIFDEEYPRTNGFIHLSAGGWTLATAALDSTHTGYGAPASASYEYILIKGGPTTGSTSIKAEMFPSDGGTANLFDLGSNRESNLKIGGHDGNTVEFWLNKSAFDTTKTKKEVIFDLIHSGTSDSPIPVHSTAYSRLRIEMSGHGAGSSTESPFYVTYVSGAGGISSTQIGQDITVSNVTDGNWHHYAFVFKNKSSTIEAKLYVDGECNHTITSGSTVDYLSGAMVAAVGSLIATPRVYTNSDGTNEVYGGNSVTRGWGKLSGSLDEFRFWKTARDSKEIGRHWRTHVGGGTNTDTANTHLGVYYKFNEGITTSSSLDSVILDYSGRVTNGNWVGYPGSSARQTGSAINAAGHGPEYLDPIIYSGHGDVADKLQELKLKGKEHDYRNNSALYRGMPEWITTEDSENDSHLKKLTQILSSYFDTLSLQMSSLPKVKSMDYIINGYNTTGSATGSSKPLPFADRLLEHAGFLTSEIFADRSVMSQVLHRDEEKYYEDKVHNIKNLIYQNIYNNILYIYKSKGTEKGLRNFFRCFGVDDELLKINVYADNVTYDLKDNYRNTVTKKKYANFFHSGSTGATVFQLTSSTNVNSVGYVSGTSGTDSPGDVNLTRGYAHTIETEVIFPKYVTNMDSDEFYHPLSSNISLFGVREAQVDLGATQYAQGHNTTWKGTDGASVQVTAVRETLASKNVKFNVSSSVFAVTMESPVFKDVYDDQKWNFALKVIPSSSANMVSGAIHQRGTLALYGVHATSDQTYDSFYITSSINTTDYDKFTKAAKRIYIGANRTNFTGSLIQPSDVKISSVRYWLADLSSDEINSHARDPSSYGINHPYRNAYMTQTNVGDYYIPKIETLALHWDFENVTGSSPSGDFIVEDITSGSIKTASERYGWLGQVLENQHTGYGWGWPANNTTKVVDNNYLSTAKTSLPENISSFDMVEVRNEDDEVFTRESRPVSHFISIEKSMYQTISEEMVNIFSSMKDYNDFIGEPVDYYRPNYKRLDKLRQLFFERVKNTPDLEKYIDFYKWVDSSINNMVLQLIPASAASSEGVRNVIEDHIFTRSKYRAKFPATERKFDDPEGHIFAINELKYNWKYGHAPITEYPISSSLLYFLNENFEYSGETSAAEDPTHLPKGWNIGDHTTATSPRGWISINNPTPSAYTGPTGAYDGDYYMYAETSGDNNPAKVFALLSPIINKDKLVYSGSTSTGGPDMFGASFYYHMYGADVGALKVKAVTVGPGATITPSSSDLLVTWDSTGTPQDSSELVGQQQDSAISDWRRADIDLRDWKEKTFRLLFHYTGGGTYRSDAAIDLVQVSGTWIGKSGRTDDNCSWYDTRAERTNSYFWHNNDSEITDLRETIRRVKNMNVSGTTFATRNFSKPYIITPEKGRSYHSGINFANKKTNYVKTALSNITDGTSNHYLEIVPHKNVDCDDVIDPNKKNKITSTVTEVSATGDFSYGKGDLLLPFNIFETDVTTGYNLKLKNSLSQSARGYMNDNRPTNIDFVNLHYDISHHGETPLQGPFTEKYVGGMSHRHVDLYTGSNNQMTRPENWILTFLSGTARVEAPTSVNKNFPRSVFYRDQVAKRPINIKNIKQSTILDSNNANPEHRTKIGNYEKEYQLVQTSGRSINNRWFVEQNGAISSSVVSTWVSGAFPAQKNKQENSTNPSVVVDFALPNRGRHSYVFVERFSAPGGPEINSRGYLDTFSEEYSVYNALPWRNLTVRMPLARLLSQSSGQFGLNSANENSASYHKQNKNTRYRFELSTPHYIHGTVATGSVNDNWYITRPIPQSDMQYAWITASAQYVTGAFGAHQINAHKAPMGYQQPNHSYASKASTDIVFASSSHVGAYLSANGREFGPDISNGTHQFVAVDFVGTNFIIYEPLTSSINHLGYTYDSDALPIMSSVTNYLYKPDTIYGHSTAHAHGPDTPTNVGNQLTYGAKIFNALMLHRNGPYGWPIWKQIRTGNHPVVRAHKKENTYSYMLEEDFLVSTNQDKIQELINEGAQYLGGPLPQKEDKTPNNITLTPVTVRYKPIEQSVTAVSRLASSELSEEDMKVVAGFDNNDKIHTSLRYTHGNNINYFPPRNDIQKEDILDQKIKFNETNELEKLSDKGSLYEYITNDAIRTNKTLYFNAIKYRENIFPKEVNTFLGKIRGRTDYTEVKGDEYKGFDRTSLYRNSFWRDNRADRLRTEGIAKNSQGYPLHSQSAIPIYLSVAAGRYRHMPYSGTFRPWGLSRWPLDSGIAGDTGLATSSEQGELWYYNTHQWDDMSSYSHLWGRQDYLPPTASQTYMFHQYFGTHAKAVITHPSIPPYYYHSSSRGIGGGGGSDYDGLAGQPLYLYHFRPQWRTAELAGKNPWYDSYDEFSEDIRAMGKDYSVIPEFKISDHMDYYLNTAKGNFLAKNNKYLNLVGATVPSSSIDETTDPLKNFYTVYSNSDFMKHFDVIQKDYGRATKLSITCKAIKKLLPYNGFYPVLRAVQLGQLFSQSYGDDLVSPVYESDSLVESGQNYSEYFRHNCGEGQSQAGPNYVPEQKGPSEQSRLQAFLEPWFAPGILYNTIKSGIAVDWPVITGSLSSPTRITGSANAFDDDRLSKNWIWYDGGWSSQGDLVNDWGGANGIHYMAFRAKHGTSTQTSAENIGLTMGWAHHYRFPFESLYKPNEYLEKVIGPAAIDLAGGRTFLRQTKLIAHVGGTQQSNNVMWNGNSKDNYRLAMHNFLAEIPRFFLRDQRMKTFASTKTGEIPFSVGTTYFMDVQLYKTDKMIQFEGPDWEFSDQALAAHGVSHGGMRFTGSARGIHYGPACELTGSENSYSTHMWADDTGVPWGGNSGHDAKYRNMRDPAYCSYTPPYFYGHSTARLTFTPELHVNTGDAVLPEAGDIMHFTIPEIISAVKEELSFNNEKGLREIKLGTPAGGIGLNPDISASFSLSPRSNTVDAQGTELPLVPEEHTMARLGQMQINASLNLFGQAKIKEFEYQNENGELIPFKMKDPSNQENLTTWVIGPHFECPILNFSGNAEGYHTRGMWMGYGETPAANEGIYMKLAESWPEEAYSKPGVDKNGVTIGITTTGSLMERLGFSGERISSERKLGEVATSREISEAIVAIPFVPNIETNIPEFIKIHPKLIKRALGSEPGDVGKSIKDMVNKMHKYVIPPQHNFLLNFPDKNEIDPFAMYIFEFKHVLDRQDLKDIWQNVMPKIAMTAEEDKQTITHDLGPLEFFGIIEGLPEEKTTPGTILDAVDLAKQLLNKSENQPEDVLTEAQIADYIIPNNVRWMVYKVKQKAETNFANVTVDNLDDQFFGVNFGYDIEEKRPNYSYNWPYDFFSLVELAKMEVEVEKVRGTAIETQFGILFPASVNSSAPGAGPGSDTGGGTDPFPTDPFK